MCEASFLDRNTSSVMAFAVMALIWAGIQISYSAWISTEKAKEFRDLEILGRVWSTYLTIFLIMLIGIPWLAYIVGSANQCSSPELTWLVVIYIFGCLTSFTLLSNMLTIPTLEHFEWLFKYCYKPTISEVEQEKPCTDNSENIMALPAKIKKM